MAGGPEQGGNSAPECHSGSQVLSTLLIAEMLFSFKSELMPHHLGSTFQTPKRGKNGSRGQAISFKGSDTSLPLTVY